MPRVITMPTSPNFVSSNFSLVRAVGFTESPFTGAYKTQEFESVYWQSQVTSFLTVAFIPVAKLIL